MRRVALLAALLAAAAPAAGRAQGTDPPVLEAASAEGPVHVDGRLDEPAWANAPVATGLRQREPGEGDPATERTEVRVLYDDHALYVGVVARDRSPDGIVARTLARDGILSGRIEGGLLSFPDDAIALVFDTFHDHRNGFLFVTNPLGSENDALIENEGADVNGDWDGVWEVAARRGPEGWTAEFAIPWTTLRFPPGESQTWGFNVARVVKRKAEEDLWSSWGRDNGGIVKLARAGVLEGLEGLRRGANLQVKPYALAEGSAANDLPGADEGADVKVGGDGKWGITPNWTLDLTVNTDFAQVEADNQQINLTRYSLFFPEKREFFLESAGIFQFGAEAFGAPPILLFFSRRVGIAAGQPVPLRGGGRITGRAGPWSVGALDVVTGAEAGEPRTNWSVVRIRRNVGRRSQWGAIATRESPDGGGGSGAYGADFRWQPTNPLYFSGFAARVDRPGETVEPWAGQLLADYTGDFWGWRLDWIGVGEGARPPVGFVPRAGYHRVFGTLRESPRPPGPIRKIDVRETATLYYGTDGRVQDRSFQFSVGPQWDSGDQASVQIERRFEALDEPFALRPDLVIPVGGYWNTAWSAGFTTSEKRPLRFSGSYSRPGFFDGERSVVGLEGGWAPSPFFDVSLGWTHNEIRTPHGDLTTDLGNLRLGLAASTRFTTDALVQYNSETDEVSANVRLDWIWSPGSDLFVVLNARRADLGETTGPSSQALIVKLTRLVRF